MKTNDRENFERARDLVLMYGWNTTCFQIVNPGISYWFGPDGRSVVGYVSWRKVRVVAGAPVCPESELRRIAAEFEADASPNGKSVCYFGAEERLGSIYRRSAEHSTVNLGAQPV